MKAPEIAGEADLDKLAANVKPERLRNHPVNLDVEAIRLLYKTMMNKQKRDRAENSDIVYTNVSTLQLSDEQLEKCAALFSENYGNYSLRSQIRPGENVRMGVAYYRNNYVREDYSAALAQDGEKIVGQAFYIRKSYADSGIMTWIVQLVVDRDYRQKGIASTLLHSIWGFSDDYAWGLASANPCTVRTLESATMRRCSPYIIKRHIGDIRKMTFDIGFVDETALEVSDHDSQVNSHFDVDNSEFSGVEEYESRLGVLKPGREWLAFTFRDQPIDLDEYEKNFSKLVAFSEKQLMEAYERMPMQKQGWAKGEKKEIDDILSMLPADTVHEVVDLGCGIGRHTLELARRGIRSVGIDYSQKQIEHALKTASDQKLNNCEFVCQDLRTLDQKEKYDLALCLYDVIGSFPEENDNRSIIRTAYDSLKHGGYLALSVMNMELTDSLVPDSQKGDVLHDPLLLLKIPPSSTMQMTGNIFDPQYMAIDTIDQIVYRKEQFSDDESLPAEYVIRDKRYRMGEIKSLLESEGFDIVNHKYVRAGDFMTGLDATDEHAKEIFVLARKNQSVHAKGD